MIILETHTIPLDTPAQRFSDYAQGLFSVYPTQNSVKKAIKRGELILNGAIEKTGTWIQPGQLIQRIDPERTPEHVFPQKMEVVFEDEALAVIQKPAGLPTSGNFYRTAQNAILYNVGLSTQADALPCPLPAHRLDRATSGLLIFAKTRSARIELGRQFETKAIQKQYEAVVMGKIPESGTLETPIDNKPSTSLYTRLDTVPSLRSEHLSLVKLQPLTGRTHQLRIHLSQAGFPILGDQLYGKEGMILLRKGLFLSAVGLSFPHPVTQEEMTFQIDAPPKFRKFMQGELRRWKAYHDNRSS